MKLIRSAVAKRISFTLRIAPILVVGLLLAAFNPGVTPWLALPADATTFFERPYTLFTYWLVPSSGRSLAESLLGLVLYGAVIQPRIPRIMGTIAAISIVVGGILFVLLANAGILVGVLPVVAGFAGATMRIWWSQRSDFAWWEHGVTAFAVFGTSMALLSAFTAPSNLIACGTAGAGAILTHFSISEPAA